MKSPLGIVFEIGYTIATPAVLMTFGGHWLDDKFGTAPWLTLSGLLLSLPLAAFAVWRKLKPHLHPDDSEEDTD